MEFGINAYYTPYNYQKYNIFKNLDVILYNNHLYY